MIRPSKLSLESFEVSTFRTAERVKKGSSGLLSLQGKYLSEIGQKADGRSLCNQHRFKQLCCSLNHLSTDSLERYYSR